MKPKSISKARRQSVHALSHCFNFKKHKALFVKYIGITGFLIYTGKKCVISIIDINRQQY